MYIHIYKSRNCVCSCDTVKVLDYMCRSKVSQFEMLKNRCITVATYMFTYECVYAYIYGTYVCMYVVYMYISIMLNDQYNKRHQFYTKIICAVPFTYTI